VVEEGGELVLLRWYTQGWLFKSLEEMGKVRDGRGVGLKGVLGGFARP
jgi:hypothetical protein